MLMLQTCCRIDSIRITLWMEKKFFPFARNSNFYEWMFHNIGWVTLMFLFESSRDNKELFSVLARKHLIFSYEKKAFIGNIPSITFDYKLEGPATSTLCLHRWRNQSYFSVSFFQLNDKMYPKLLNVRTKE